MEDTLNEGIAARGLLSLSETASAGFSRHQAKNPRKKIAADKTTILFFAFSVNYFSSDTHLIRYSSKTEIQERIKGAVHNIPCDDKHQQQQSHRFQNI